MYLNKKIKDYARQTDTTKTDEEKAFEVMRENQKEKEYFLNREKIEQELNKEIESKLPEVIQKSLNSLINGLK